mgnify:CR=1 FL=1
MANPVLAFESALMAQRVAREFALQQSGSGLSKLAGRQLDEIRQGLADLEALSENLTEVEQTFDAHFG